MSPEMIAAAQASGLSADEVTRILNVLRGYTVRHHIEPSAVIGSGAKVWHFAVVLQDVVIGDDCSIGSGTEIGRGSRIGHGTRIGSQVFLPPHSVIGANVFVGPGCTFTDDRHPKIHAPDDPPYHAEPPTIEDGAVIGAGCVILPGVHIGTGAVIGAGAVVARDVLAGSHVRGEPARTRTLSESSATQFLGHTLTLNRGHPA